MIKKVQCQNLSSKESVRVKVIRAPLVDSQQLRKFILARTKAVVL